MSLTSGDQRFYAFSMRQLAVFILMIGFMFSSLLTGLGAHGDECKPQSTVETVVTTSHDTEAHQGQSEQNACHCPLHRAGCCTTVGFITRTVRTLSYLEVTSLYASSEADFVKQDPTLEGPFQPPRA